MLSLTESSKLTQELQQRNQELEEKIEHIKINYEQDVGNIIKLIGDKKIDPTQLSDQQYRKVLEEVADTSEHADIQEKLREDPRFLIEHHNKGEDVTKKYSIADYEKLEKIFSSYLSTQSELPEVEGYTLQRYYKKSHRPGGDNLFSYLRTDGTNLLVLIDVEGQGFEALCYLLTAKVALEQIIECSNSPAQILYQWHQRIRFIQNNNRLFPTVALPSLFWIFRRRFSLMHVRQCPTWQR